MHSKLMVNYEIKLIITTEYNVKKVLIFCAIRINAKPKKYVAN